MFHKYDWKRDYVTIINLFWILLLKVIEYLVLDEGTIITKGIFESKWGASIRPFNNSKIKRHQTWHVY